MTWSPVPAGLLNSGHPLYLVLLSAFLMTQGQLGSKNITFRNCRNKQFTSFRLCSFLSSTINIVPFRSVLPVLFVRRVHAVGPARLLVTEWPFRLSDQLWWYRGAWVPVALVLLRHGPKAQKQWCWQPGDAKEEPSNVSFEWKGESARLYIRNEKQSYAEVAKTYVMATAHDSCLGILKEWEHISIISIKVYCYNCSILLWVIVVSLLLCLIYKLNFITGTYVEEKRSACRVQHCSSFWVSTGGLEACPLWIYWVCQDYCPGCVTLNRLPNHSVPQLPHLLDRINNNAHIIKLLQRLTKFCMWNTKSCRAHIKY